MLKAILSFMIIFPVHFIAGQSFQGSFLMTFNVNNDSIEEPPLYWNIGRPSENGQMAMEIHDDMWAKGVKKRVIFSPVDSTWLMLMEFNNVKQGARVHRSSLFARSAKKNLVKARQTGIKKNIEGYECIKHVVESNEYTAELWIAPAVKFNMANIYKLLSHCGMISTTVRKGDWYKSKQMEGMIVSVTSRSKVTGQTYTMNISAIKKGNIDPAIFDIKGFRISEIPDGENCGVPMDEK